MIRVVSLLLAAAAVCGCGGGAKKSAPQAAQTQTVLDSLIGGEERMTDGVFGQVVELTGVPVAVDDIFKVSEATLLCVDSLLVMQNRQRADGHFLSVYSLPEMRFVASLGTIGRGPGEFVFPQLVPAAEDDRALCYVFDSFGGQFSALTRELTLQPFAPGIPEEYLKYASEKMYAARDTADMIFNHGWGVFRFADGSVRQLFDLSLAKVNPNVGYVGSLAVNFEGERFAYAYKFVKRIVFGDFDGTVRTLQFGKAERDLEDNAAGERAPIDRNVTHYWKIAAGRKYVYVSYSGRSPVEVHEQGSRGERYIFVEVFDWNGVPVKKFRLDRWGYFTVDERRGTLWLFSTWDAEPVWKYELQLNN